MKAIYLAFNRSSNARALSRLPPPSSARNMASHVDGYKIVVSNMLVFEQMETYLAMTGTCSGGSGNGRCGRF